MESLAAKISADFERTHGLAWLVRGLLLIGREGNGPHEQVRLLEMLQSLIGSTGQHFELIDAIEGAKRSFEESPSLEAETEALLPESARELRSRLNEPGLSSEQIDAIKQEAALRLVGAAASSEDAVRLRGILERLSDPRITEREREELQETASRYMGGVLPVK